MDVEFANPNLEMDLMYDDDDVEYLSDSSDAEVISSIASILTAVKMTPSKVGQEYRDEYDNLVSILDPAARLDYRDKDRVALFVAALKALSGSVSKIDAIYHGDLLTNIFNMCIWNYRSEDIRSAILELITSLAAVPDKFLESCLHMLVNNFKPPRRLRDLSGSQLVDKKKIHGEIYRALHCIADLVPLAPMKLKDVIVKRMPRSTDPQELITSFVECMLGLESNEIGEFLGNTLVAKVVDLLTDLDVNISWEDILQEEPNKNVFHMELEDVDENAIFGTKIERDKLDGLMVIVCEYLKSCAYNGHLIKVFETLTESFRKTVMNAYKSKFAQFVMFYACSLDPEICGQKFAVLLTDIFLSITEYPSSRMSAVAYLASYLSRAKFISSRVVASILKRLVDWCSEYCQLQNGSEKTMSPKDHRVFYSGCQAVMYILCFRMRSLIDDRDLKLLLFYLPLEPVLYHPLEPLKVCLPSIVREFLQQAKAAQWFKTSAALPYNKLLESEFSKAWGGTERLDMFFPFDPCLLEESDRKFMKPNFEFWCNVKKTYGDLGEDEELNGPEFADNGGHDNLELDSEDDDDDDDDIELSMNKMSITPRPAFHYPMPRNLRSPSPMPAKIRPSVSPDDY